MITTTMKKEYIAPEALAYELRMRSTLLAGSSKSLDDLINDPTTPITPGGDMPDVEGGDNVFNSREFDYEDEDF